MPNPPAPAEAAPTVSLIPEILEPSQVPPRRTTGYVDGRESAQSRYTEERMERICLALAQGNTRQAAAQAGNVTYGTLRKWMAQYEDVAERVEEAEAKAERAFASVISKSAMEGNADAAKFWLERRRPENWGRTDRLDVVVRRQQAADLVEELRAEGIEVTVEEILGEYDTLKQRSLPPGTRR